MSAVRLPFFYGWTIVGVGMLNAAFATGTSIFAISILAAPMEEELGWSRAAIFGALSARALFGGMLGPIIGRFYDHPQAPRYMVVAGSVLMGVTIMSVRWVEELWAFYLVYGFLGSLAHGATGPVVGVLVPKWFVRRRARALAHGNMGSPLGTLIFPLLIAGLITTVGWRDTWLYLGIITLAVLVPLALLVRASPESMGLLPDGEPAGAQGAGGGRRAPAEESVTVREATHSRTFWLMALAFPLGVFSIQGYQPNWFPYFQSIGFEPGLAALAISIYGFFAMAARQIWGYAADKLGARRAMMLQTFLTGLGVLLLLSVQNVYMLMLFAAFQGLTMGGYYLMQQFLLASYVGRGHIGAINGLLRPAITVGQMLGPVTTAAIFDLGGAYQWVLLPIFFTWMVCSALVSFTRPIRRAAGAGA